MTEKRNREPNPCQPKKKIEYLLNQFSNKPFNCLVTNHITTEKKLICEFKFKDLILKLKTNVNI
jgi:hypothetical protein